MNPKGIGGYIKGQSGNLAGRGLRELPEGQTQQVIGLVPIAINTANTISPIVIGSIFISPYLLVLR